jgi:hypothetical protein
LEEWQLKPALLCFRQGFPPTLQSLPAYSAQLIMAPFKNDHLQGTQKRWGEIIVSSKTPNH